MDAHSTVTAEEGDRYPLGPPSLSLLRLAAMPPRLGRGFRGFESHRRDQSMRANYSFLAQLVEQHLDTVKVTGSIPVGTTNYK